MNGVIKLIHDEALKVLFYIGVECRSPLVKEVFESTQMAFFDETTNRIHISKKLIEYCLEILPKRQYHSVPNKSFGGGGSAAFWVQGDDHILPVNEIHTAEMFRLAEEFKIPFMFKSCGRVEENDIEIMRKYYTGYIYTEAKNRKMAEDLKGESDICTAHSIIVSPLRFSDVDKLFICLENDLSVYLTTMPIGCSTGPATMYSLATLAWAEFLAGMCLVQIKRPGTLVVNGAYPAAGDPRDGYRPALGSVFHNLCNYTVAKVSNYFSVPSVQSGCTINGLHIPNGNHTDSDSYSGFALWNKFEGWHQVRHCFGFTNGLISFDINKMRRDCVSLASVLENDIKHPGEVEEINYDPETVEAIEQGIPCGFKEITHTTKHIGLLMEYLSMEGLCIFKN